MLLAGTPLAAPKVQVLRLEIASGVTGNRMVRTRQGRATREERAATCVRRVGGEATLRALASARLVCEHDESSARSVASAAARFAGRGPFLTLRRCAGEREIRNERGTDVGDVRNTARYWDRVRVLLARAA